MATLAMRPFQIGSIVPIVCESRITVLDGSNVTPRHLNKHINYSIRPAPAGVKEDSLATPMGMVFDGTGTNLYVAAFGSGKVGRFNTAALENDTRVLAMEVGRGYGHRVNVISAGPYASRAATAIGFIGTMIEYSERVAPLPEVLRGEEVGNAAAFLASPLASGITGHTLYVDKGFHAVGAPVDLLEKAKAETA